ncbi:ABC transporter permease [Nocardioides daphniae]|uniref:Exporter of polyketide antibiotics n=1 Tax=Nocardioides daphniae TaxID=402297 RepID=A0A4P7UGM1_9ACTN|nr:multidrug ABC transporter permease [Nocardioides daphniae]QCC78505.1 multidrug ABC transporter permease [Nocardioides daphniae]GGD11862.1 exporter of polyketide antibiotics [Nocardioides daphniae]
MSATTGVRPLLAATLHQDARAIAPWVVLISVLSASSILAFALVFPDPADRSALELALAGNPALSLVFGPVRDLATADGFNAWRAGQLGALFAGLMTILVVVRNSRAGEDSGQAELVASAVVGRPARLAVAVLLAVIASVALGVVCFVLTVAVGGGVAATAVLAASFTASGLVFAGVAAVTAQVGSDARSASSLAVGALAGLYVLRGYLDMSGAGERGQWWTPFGWGELAAPSVDDDPRPLLLSVVATLVLVAVAFALQSRRDFGHGLLAPRRGPERAGMTGSVWGLALSLHREALVGWMAGFAALGLLVGNLATTIDDVVADNPAMASIVAAGVVRDSDFTAAYVVTILQVIAIVASVLGVQVVLRICAEELDVRVDPLLAGSLRRRTYLASNALVAFVATGLAMLVAGVSLGLVASAREESLEFGDVVLQAVVTVPGVWVLVGIALLVVGAAPRVRAVAWLGVVATFALTLLGPTFRLPDWALDISPLRHVPRVVLPAADWSGLVGLLVLVAALTVAGFVGFRRRDLL